MIIVSGTGRSGTSIWMHALAEAGVPIIGERYPLDWEESLQAFNTDGFYESTLRAGINFSTNRDPFTGDQVDPVRHRGHAVKVFTSGLLRTERRYIGHVVYTTRHWRAFVRSAGRLLAADAPHTTLPLPDVATLAEAWFRENLLVILDASARAYHLLPVSFERTLEDPRGQCHRVGEYLGQPLLELSIRLQRAMPQEEPQTFPRHVVSKCDRLHDMLTGNWPPRPSEIDALAGLL